MYRKIKVLQVVGRLRIGGAETVAMNLYRYINRNKFEFHYLVYEDDIGDYEEEVIQLGGKVIHINYSSRYIKRYRNDLLNVMKENGPYDIIHVHMMFHNGIVLQIAKKAGIPVKVSHSHSTNDGGIRYGNIKDITRNLYLKYSRRLICINADILLGCGEEAGNYLYGNRVFAEKGILIKNGINIDKYHFNKRTRNVIREQYGFNNEKIYGCIGHFDRVKNHTFLIDIFEKIHMIDKKAILVLLGEGKLRQEIEHLCKDKHLEPYVVFMGNVNNVNEWLQAMDFLLMPSLYEGIPLTLIEAQASGIKCFVSDRVAKEANVTGEITYIPLNVDKWVELMQGSIDYNRTEKNEKCLIDNGYDIRTNVKKVEEKYMEKLVNFDDGKIFK